MAEISADELFCVGYTRICSLLISQSLFPPVFYPALDGIEWRE